MGMRNPNFACKWATLAGDEFCVRERELERTQGRSFNPVRMFDGLEWTILV